MKKINISFEKIPDIILRVNVGNYFDGAISPKTLANLDSLGRGPQGKFLINGKVAYPRDEFFRWLANRSNPKIIFSLKKEDYDA